MSSTTSMIVTGPVDMSGSPSVRLPQAALYVCTTTNGVVSSTLLGDYIRAEINLALKLLPKTDPNVSGAAWNDGGMISEDS